jgi:hypothetical protein
MKSIINLAYVFLCIGILNFVFLVDTILTDPEIEFSIFSIATTKTINIIYYGVICTILLLAGIYIIRTNKKIIK